MPGQLLCRLDELPEIGGRGFAIDGNAYLAVRRHSDVFVYHNRCPHIGTPLNWQQDQFLDSENQFIQCASHGALFEIDGGLCVAGPCHGKALDRVGHTLKNGEIYI